MKPMRCLLIEPGYRNKYPPLGLMKLAAYHKARGDKVLFIKGINHSAVRARRWDRAYVTTLFSFEWARTASAIDFAIQAVGGKPDRVFVGGIAASLMPEAFRQETKWSGVHFITGLLTGPPAQALRLPTSPTGSAHHDPALALPIDEQVPDYGLLTDTDYRYPVHDAYFGYATRGCVRRCRFCGVPALEGDQRDMPPLRRLIDGVDRLHGQKRHLILMDNNVTASARYVDLIAEIRDIGFTAGAKLLRNGRRYKRRVDFNQGVDARILSKSPMYLRELSTICIDPLRIAFDHIGLKGVYESSVRMAADNGITSLSNYMLYNFMDTPRDLYERMHLNISLNESMGIRIWSFPMRYQPVKQKDRHHVGKHWNPYYLRSFQLILQATHGVVSGNPAFFSHAFGQDSNSFMRLLSYPHGMIFHRRYFDSGDGRSIKDEYERCRQRLTPGEETEFLECLVAPGLGGEQHRAERYAAMVAGKEVSSPVRQALAFHVLGSKSALDPALSRLKALSNNAAQLSPLPPREIRIEDAGLYDSA